MRHALPVVVDAFRADLAARGDVVEAPDDPLADEAFIAALNSAYRLPRPVEA